MRYKVSMQGIAMPPEVLRVLLDDGQMQRFLKAIQTLRELMGLDQCDTLKLEIEESSRSNLIPFDRPDLESNHRSEDGM